jgi:hypothetical protein
MMPFRIGFRPAVRLRPGRQNLCRGKIRVLGHRLVGIYHLLIVSKVLGYEKFI